MCEDELTRSLLFHRGTTLPPVTRLLILATAISVLQQAGGSANSAAEDHNAVST